MIENNMKNQLKHERRDKKLPEASKTISQGGHQ